MQACLEPSHFIDSDHPRVIEFAERWRGAEADPRRQAVALYRAVRDGIRYNPYAFSRDPRTLKASHALAAGESCCVPKAILPAACARHCGIASRIGLADLPEQLFFAHLQRCYPHLFAAGTAFMSGDKQAEAAAID